MQEGSESKAQKMIALESLVDTLAAGIMMLPLAILGIIPISTDAKIMLAAVFAIPYMFAYLKVMFWVEDWGNNRRHRR